MDWPGFKCKLETVGKLIGDYAGGMGWGSLFPKGLCEDVKMGTTVNL